MSSIISHCSCAYVSNGSGNDSIWVQPSESIEAWRSVTQSVALYFVDLFSSYLVYLLIQKTQVKLSSNSKDSSHDGSRYYSIKLLSPGFIRTKISLRSLTFVKDSGESCNLGEICNSDSLSDREQRFPSSLTNQNKDPWVVFNQADWYQFSTSIFKKFGTWTCKIFIVVAVDEFLYVINVFT